ncbi:sensor histidine kinase [Alkalilacustris brevis]|uniref:sensor histidine kinase n=1 Tax=Alkalilacustris brevis TaxID=2026338 RepID=UPI000E0D205A|nr:ATP-binding protein [Alkalilacustris brevis]
MQGHDFTPYKIAAIYLFAGVSYILVSDWLVVGSATAGWRPGLDTAKGVGFVVVSAALIAWLVRRELQRREDVIKAAGAAQRLEALGRLTAGVAHDFNNLLTVVINSAELLHDGLDDRPDQQRHAGAILGAGERAARLVENLLVFARQHPVHPQRFDANERIEALEPLMAQALGKHILLSLDLGGKGPFEVLTDPVQFDSTLLNLTVNARDAMPEGGQLRIESKRLHLNGSQAAPLQAAPGDYLAISVADQGEGMTDEVMQRAFEPFFTTKGPDRGTGLGLSTIFGYMRDARGAVALHSTPGKGTRVTLYFPLAAPAA